MRSPVNGESGMAVFNRALVVGGGIAGMSAALAVADHGVDVTLVETAEDQLGGNLAWLDQTIDGTPDRPLSGRNHRPVDKHPRHRGDDRQPGGRCVRSGRPFFLHRRNPMHNPPPPWNTGPSSGHRRREAPTDAYGYGTSEAVVTQKELGDPHS
jgi:heterodisulfide reductase subunit A